jgi:hypothetical protein
VINARHFDPRDPISVDEQTAEIVAPTAGQAANAEVTARCVRTALGGEWSTSTVRNLLQRVPFAAPLSPAHGGPVGGSSSLAALRVALDVGGAAQTLLGRP